MRFRSTRTRLRPYPWACFIAFVLLFLVPAASRAENADRVVVVLSSGQPAYALALAGVRATFSSQKSTATVEDEVLDGQKETVEHLIERLNANPPQLIITIGSHAATAMRGRVPSSQLIYALVSDPDRHSDSQDALVTTTQFAIESQFTWLRKLLPQARVIGSLYDPRKKQAFMNEAERVAGRLGFSLVSRPVKSAESIPEALESLAREIDVLWIINDPLIVSPATAKNLLVFSYRNRIPFVGLSDAWVKAGALYALDLDFEDLGKQCGELAVEYLDQGILPPGSIVFPRTVSYTINSSAASHLNIEMSQSTIQNARHIHD